MNLSKSQQDIAIENAIKLGKCQLIKNIPATQFSLYYDSISNSHCIFYKGKKKPTKYTNLDVELLKYINHDFSIVVKGNRFNFFPAAQEDLLFENKSASLRKKIDDAQSLIENAIETYKNDIAEELRNTLGKITIPYNNFIYNGTSQKYEAFYDIRNCLNLSKSHVTMDIDDFEYTCEYYGLDEENVFDTAKTIFRHFEADLTFDDIFPGENPIFKVEMTPLLYSLLKENKSFEATLKYDDWNECICYDNLGYDRHVDFPDSLEKQAKSIAKSGLFLNHRDDIFRYIKKCKNSNLKRAFIYAFLLAFDYKELKDAVYLLGGNSYSRLKIPNALNIHSSVDSIKWKWLEEKFSDVFGGCVISFCDSNHTCSEGYYDWWGPNQTHTSYVVPYQSKYSRDIKIYLYSLTEDKSTYVFIVHKDKVILAMFFIWAYFASNVIDNKRQDNLLDDFFRREKIGWMEKNGAMKYTKDGYLGYRW